MSIYPPSPPGHDPWKAQRDKNRKVQWRERLWMAGDWVFIFGILFVLCMFVVLVQAARIWIWDPLSVLW